MPTSRSRASRPGEPVYAPPDPSAPKTTRPPAEERRLPEPERTAARKMARRLDALPDRIDIRDWLYQPRLAPVPDQLVNCDLVPRILDQGTEGACTGFALAAVVNFLLAARGVRRAVSPRMLYELARRYDEWPGEDYEGSSARGAMKAWVRHGVCAERSWKASLHGAEHFTQKVSDEARATPGGAFYRVMHRQVRDMHAALAEVGILYVTLMVHAGWEEPGPTKATVRVRRGRSTRRLTLPVIERRGAADSGHAVALVGYTPQGFIVQNSWGRSWGAGGFALLPYEDYMLHATDVWAAQLGVPVLAELWEGGAADTTQGIQRAGRVVSLNEIRPFVIDVGNSGELSRSGDYWTTEEDLRRLFTEHIPEAAKGWSKRRVLLYLHGGLNDEQSCARRIVAFRDVMLDNEIYPVHVMWESGLVESLNSLIRDLFTNVDERAGGPGDWMRRFRDGLVDARDRTLELTAARPGGALWREMKENARLTSDHPDGRGGMQLLARHAAAAMATLSARERASWELHVVGHSAGSIVAAHALPHLSGAGVSFSSIQLMAPAITTAMFRRLVVPAVREGRCPRPTVYLLSGVGERDDTVGPYGKSLLYLVSNAFEGRRNEPLVGMERFVRRADPRDDEHVDRELEAFFAEPVDGLPSLVVAGRDEGPASRSRSSTHGGFDNDPDTLNSVLRRVLRAEPAREFTVRDLQY
jgi:hypothetical protein